MAQQATFERAHVRARRPAFGKIADPGPYRGHALGADFLRIHAQRLAQAPEIHVHQQGAVVQHLAPVNPLAAARYLASVHFQVIAARNFGPHPHIVQGFAHRFQVTPEIHPLLAVGVFNEGKIEIARIMVDRAAAGDAPYHRQIFAPYEIGVDFLGGALVAAHNNGRAILPEHEKSGMFRRQGIKKPLFKSQIKSGVQRRKCQKFHGGLVMPLVSGLSGARHGGIRAAEQDRRHRSLEYTMLSSQTFSMPKRPDSA